MTQTLPSKYVVRMHYGPGPTWLGQISRRPLASVESKHCAPSVNTKISVLLRRLAAEVAYPFADIGIEERHSLADDRACVTAMAALEIRPIKIVITLCGRVWTDNTHRTLAALRKYGRDCAIGDVPHYMVQFTHSDASMYARPLTMGLSTSCEALRLAHNIQRRLAVGWRPPPISYTIGELFEEGGYHFGR